MCGPEVIGTSVCLIRQLLKLKSKKMIDLIYDKFYKNALFVIGYRLAYLGFVDAYIRDYNICAQKCIKNFTI